MHEHLCPKCGEKSYSADERGFAPCPYCGLRFSGQYGPDRRSEERIRKESGIVLSCRGQLLNASLTDSSDCGLGVSICGKTQLGVNDTVEVDINSYPIKGRVMWVNELSDKSMVGLQRIPES
jgi:hypothetical protein